MKKKSLLFVCMCMLLSVGAFAKATKPKVNKETKASTVHKAVVVVDEVTCYKKVADPNGGLPYFVRVKCPKIVII